MTLKYGILSQSTAVFPQSVENVVNTRSCMKKNKYRHIPWNRYNLEKYRDIDFWSYRPALQTNIYMDSHSDGTHSLQWVIGEQVM